MVVINWLILLAVSEKLYQNSSSLKVSDFLHWVTIKKTLLWKGPALYFGFTGDHYSFKIYGGLKLWGVYDPFTYHI